MISVPISWGELIDKITILEIKTTRLGTEAQRDIAMKELLLLQKLLDEEKKEKLHLEHESLWRINGELWKLENLAREFIKKDNNTELRLVIECIHYLNGARATAKKRINDLMGSLIQEQKEYFNA